MPFRLILHLPHPSKEAEIKEDVDELTFQWTSVDLRSDVTRDTPFNVSVIVRPNASPGDMPKKSGPSVFFVKTIGGGSKVHAENLRLRNMVRFGLAEASDLEICTFEFLEAIFGVAVTFSDLKSIGISEVV